MQEGSLQRREMTSTIPISRSSLFHVDTFGNFRRGTKNKNARVGAWVGRGEHEEGAKNLNLSSLSLAAKTCSQRAAANRSLSITRNGTGPSS